MVKRSSIRRKWKKHEQRIAEKFGTHRTPLSGSSSRHKTSSDIIHQLLYIECKYRSRIAILDGFPKVAKKAKAEGKIPVMAIKSKELKDDYFLICARDLEKIAILLKQAKPKVTVSIGDEDNGN